MFIFLLGVASQNCTAVVHGVVEGVPVLFPIPQSDGCKSGIQCPVEPQKSYSYVNQLPVKTGYPPVSVHFLEYLPLVLNNAVMLHAFTSSFLVCLLDKTGCGMGIKRRLQERFILHQVPCSDCELKASSEAKRLQRDTIKNRGFWMPIDLLDLILVDADFMIYSNTFFLALTDLSF